MSLLDYINYNENIISFYNYNKFVFNNKSFYQSLNYKYIWYKKAIKYI